MESKSEIQHQPERAGDVKHSLASVDRIKATGFQPSSNFDEGLKQTIRFFQTGQSSQ